MHGWDLDSYAKRAEASGWEAIELDGHDLEAIEAGLSAAEAAPQPTMLVARTKKGKGVAAVEDQPGKHGKPLPDAAAAIAELGGERDLTVAVAKPQGEAEPRRFEAPGGELPGWERGEEVATRKAYGDALAALGNRRGDVLALDGEVSTRPTPRTSARPTPSATWRCTSPSSR